MRRCRCWRNGMTTNSPTTGGRPRNLVRDEHKSAVIPWPMRCCCRPAARVHSRVHAGAKPAHRARPHHRKCRTVRCSTCFDRHAQLPRFQRGRRARPNLWPGVAFSRSAPGRMAQAWPRRVARDVEGDRGRHAAGTGPRLRSQAQGSGGRGAGRRPALAANWMFADILRS